MISFPSSVDNAIKKKEKWGVSIISGRGWEQSSCKTGQEIMQNRRMYQSCKERRSMSQTRGWLTVKRDATTMLRGECIKHGAMVKTCSYEGCTNHPKKGGVCSNMVDHMKDYQKRYKWRSMYATWCQSEDLQPWRMYLLLARKGRVCSKHRVYLKADKLD